MDSEDLVQDVLLSAFKNFESINEDKFLHYLIRSARLKSISNWRKNKYKTELLDKHHNNLIARDVSADVILDIQLLYKTLNKLPNKQKDALVLFEISGFSFKEIAEIQESTEGAVKTKVSRGRSLLKKLLQEEQEEIPNNIKGRLQTGLL